MSDYENEWEKCLAECNERTRKINKSYPNGAYLLNTTIKDAMLWVPQYIMGRINPTSDQLIELGTKILAIGIATELANKARSIGY